MAAGDPTHSWHGWNGRRDGTRRQIDDPLAGRAGARDSLRRGLADQQTVARTANVLLAWGRIPDGSCLHAAGTLDDVLVALVRDVNHSLADPASDHWYGSVVEVGRHLVRTRNRSPMFPRFYSREVELNVVLLVDHCD